MSRVAIDYGIDLGTTNSSIAVLDRGVPSVIRNRDQWPFTPSAVWMDGNGTIRVGRAAKQRLVSDPDNAVAEFKLWMGTSDAKSFVQANRIATPPELSAEVLKSLKQDVLREKGENLTAAVITVPAAFDSPESAATRKAAQLAGIQHSPLLQEPIAAALAYGFQAETNKAFWLVFDIGGGTFDAAVIHVADGVIEVVNHGGDKHLGGKLIDWAIVESHFVPLLKEHFNLPNFTRDNPRWFRAFAKLKQLAEEAKIMLSTEESINVSEIDIGVGPICLDSQNREVVLEYSLSRSHIEEIVGPLLAKSVNICRTVLSEKHLGTADVEKVLLVGGPTYTPFIRDVLPDESRGLGIPIEYSIDPLTVVAQGAALFAGSQRLQAATRPQGNSSTYQVHLEYKPVGSETQPLVGGKVDSPRGNSLAGFSIRFINPDSRPQWISANIPLQENGAFMATLWAEKQRQNIFTIELLDATGTPCPVSPLQFPYTVGLVITDPPLTHNIGVAEDAR